jgi:DNA replication initiation complex subunit (GINS family)
MDGVKITYETLFDLLRREKSREDLQELEEVFYNDVMVYLEQKKKFLQEKASQTGLFGSPDSDKAKIQIQNIKKIVKELYERREAKILKLAVNKARTGSNIANTIAMLSHEKVFFNEALELLTNSRGRILNKILTFGNGHAVNIPQPISQPAEELESEPELSYEESNNNSTTIPVHESDQIIQEEKSPEKTIVESIEEYDVKVKVRFIAAVPKFLGKKSEIYGPFEENQIAELPRVIANILVNKGRADILNTSL